MKAHRALLAALVALAPAAAFAQAEARPAPSAAAPAPAATDPAAADPAAADPAAAVRAFMRAFDAQDADAMRAMAIEGASVTVIEERAGADRVRAVPLEGLIASIAGSSSDLAEPIRNLEAIEAGPVATVTAEYEFLIDGALSHCGVNMLNLVRVDGAWKIAGIAYSHIEEPCEGALAQ